MSDKTSELLSVIATIVLVVACLLLAQQRDDLKLEAVKRGFAEWIISDNGGTTFQSKGEIK
jgi:hypothetical protein